MALAMRPVPSSPPAGDAADAGRLFEEHSDRLFAYCLRFLGSRAEAEDAVQTTFLYAHRALQRGVVPQVEYVWLHSIAKNVCRWQKRTIARRGTLSTDLDLDAFPSQAGNEGEVRQLRMELDDALASIPANQREALLLREWHGLSSHEVASRLGMSAAATYALLTRARRSLVRAMSAALVFDPRALLAKLKGLFAGGVAKVAATGFAVGTVAVGGVAVGEAAMTETEPRPTTPAAAVDENGAVSARIAELSGLQAGATRVGAAGTSQTRVSKDSQVLVTAGTTTSPASAVDSQPDPTQAGDSPATTDPRELLPTTPPLPENPLESLPLPEVELPPLDLPPVDPPPVDVPPVDVPPVDVPPLEPPVGDLPPVDPPPVDVPPVDVPPVDVPPVDVPPAEVPPLLP